MAERKFIEGLDDEPFSAWHHKVYAQLLENTARLDRKIKDVRREKVVDRVIVGAILIALITTLILGGLNI